MQDIRNNGGDFINTKINVNLKKNIKNMKPEINKNRIKINKSDYKTILGSHGETYIILTTSNYNDAFNSSFKVKELREMCKYYKLKRTGKKQDLQNRIYNYLHESKYASKIQKAYRGYLTRKYFNLIGPGLHKKTECVNDCDFCTLEPLEEIPYYQFFSFKVKNMIYGFDICSLYNFITKHQKSKTIKLDKRIPDNPYTREQLPICVLEKLNELVHIANVLNMPSELKIEQDNQDLTLKELNNQRSFQIFQEINQLGNYSDHEWFLNLTKPRLIIFIRELYDIWNYRAQIPNETKVKICHPNGNPFFNFSFSFINQMSEDQLKNRILEILKKLVYDGINDEFRSLGAYYILASLTLVNENAAIALPWLYQSVSYT